MVKRYTSRFSVLVLGLLLSTLVNASATLTVFNGEADVLKNYTGKGKWLVVMIWASDCHICNVEAESYIMLHETHKDKDATLMGISTDGPSGMAEAKAFIKRHHVTFPNLIAEHADVVRLYAELTGVYMAGTPAFLIFGPDGSLQAQQVGAIPAEMIANFITENSQ